MKVLLLTGGNEGIGYYMTKQWLENGDCASVLDLNCDNINKLKEKYPQTLITNICNVCDIETVKLAVDMTNTKFGTINYAVHNACICLFENFEKLNRDDFNKVMDVNFYGAINLTKAVLPFMKMKKEGKIYFTSSGVGVTGYTNISPYASSKGALESLAKCLNNEYEASGITFHIMHPPLTNTKSSSPLPVPKEFKASPEKVGKGFVKHMESKKFIITPSFTDGISIKSSYLFPLSMGKLLIKMSKKSSSNC